MTVPRISVVIPHYDDPASLDRCLSALGQQTIAEPFEIVVADNMSPQGEAAIAAAIGGRARLALAHDRGAGPARNAGVAESTGEVLAFTDSDCVPQPGWLAAGVAALERHDLVGGRMTVEVGANERSGAEAFEQVFAFDNRSYVEDKGFTVTANLFVRRATFDAVGGFRTQVSEDAEWCWRARAAGYRLGYAHDAVVGHPARPDWAALLHKWRRINAESFALACEARGGRMRWLAKSWLLPVSIVAHVPRVLRSPALSQTAHRRAALATLARLRMWRFVDSHRLLFTRR